MLRQCVNTRASLTLTRTALTTATAKPLSRIDRKGIKTRGKGNESTSKHKESALVAETPLAKQIKASLHNRAVVKARKLKQDANSKSLPRRSTESVLKGTGGDRARVNIVSDSMCHDILTTLGPSLERHKGCDLIDIFPGAGLWSQKIHNILQPRSHILMEPDVEVYTPFLQPLLDQPTTRLVPKSGIVWDNLNSILTPEYLPHQSPIPLDPAVVPKRNDTLLVIANISYYPKRKFGGFASVSHLLLYQLASTLRASSLFQKYGLVRMLLWIPPSERYSLLPRTVTLRGRSAMEVDITTEWINEVTQPSVEPDKSRQRDPDLDLESDIAVLERMRLAGIPPPPEQRQSPAFKSFINGGTAPVRLRQYAKEQVDLQNRLAAGEFELDHNPRKPGLMKERDPLAKRLLALRYRAQGEERYKNMAQDLIDERDKLVADIQAGRIDDAEREAREAAWNETLSTSVIRIRQNTTYRSAETNLLRQNPPGLAWDRRSYEPMVVEPTEFLPNSPLCLLDIQPKAAHPFVRSLGPANDHAGDMFELILKTMMAWPSQLVSQGLGNCWPGAAEELLPKCPSLRDPSKGGSVLRGEFGELQVRELNEHHLTEIMEAWMAWPFRPSFVDLLSRLGDDTGTNDEPPHPWKDSVDLEPY